MKISKEVQVAFITIGGIAALYFGFNYLKGQNLFSNTNTFYVIYDRVESLKQSNNVTINGLKVGQIDKITFLQEQHDKILVTLEINSTIKIPLGTKALLTDGGLLDDKVIELVISDNQDGHDVEDTLIGIQKQGLADILKERAIPILVHLDSAAADIDKVIKNIIIQGENVSQITTNLAEFTGQLKKIADDVDKNLDIISDKTKSMVVNFEKMSQDLPKISQKLSQFSDSLNDVPITDMSKNLQETLDNMNQIVTTLNSTKGTVGSLINNDSMYYNLNQLIIDLNTLIVDLKTHPKKYVHFSVFSKKDKKTK